MSQLANNFIYVEEGNEIEVHGSHYDKISSNILLKLLSEGAWNLDKDP